MKHVFIIGSKGIPAKYGGFETFVDKLTEYLKHPEIKFHVSCLSEGEESDFEYNGARCFNVRVPEIGSAKAVLYDIKSLKACVEYIKKNNLKNCIIYLLACRIGPYLAFYRPVLRRLNIKFYVNPDGNEWKRSKWNRYIRAYWKVSERFTVQNCDLLVCDSRGMEEYIHREYKQFKPRTTFVAYGADLERSKVPDNAPELLAWYSRFGISPGNYYLIVGRFVPENNYETMIREFMASSTTKDLVIITNVEKNKFYEDLAGKTGFEKDSRVKFIGTLYDQDLLKKIRENACAYIHGHEVGGTNPSLLEALASTPVNLLLEVNFNKEVGEEGALYFSKEKGSLAGLINSVEAMDSEKREEMASLAVNRIKDEYTWERIASLYQGLLLNA